MRELTTRALHITRNFWYFRYLDNLPGILDTRTTTLLDVERAFRRIYDMPLKLESAGIILDTLELRVTLTGEHIAYAPKPMLHDILAPPMQPLDPSICRIPPYWCSNRKGFLGFYLPSALLKCVRNASSLLGMVMGFYNLMYGLQKHGYTISTLLALLKAFCYSRNIMSFFFFPLMSYLLEKHLDLQPG